MLTVKAFQYRYAGALAQPLNIPAFSAAPAQMVWLAGESGCGKTTALNLIAGLLPPPAGVMALHGQDPSAIAPKQRDAWRAAHVGLIPQAPQLIDGLTALQNVCWPLALAGKKLSTVSVMALMDTLGLAAVQAHKPAQLSRGQQQRVAIARAFASQPALILADEPTANLDDTHTQAVLDALKNLCMQLNCAAVIASHDVRIAPYCSAKVVFA